MTDKIFKTVKEHNMIDSGDTVGVGLSGGADSVALTHFLAVNREKLGIKKLTAVHIHHGIRGAEADRDLEFSRHLAESLKTEFISFRADVPAEAEKTGESIEECARRIRYEFFEKCGFDKFATAHSLNDNMETFLFNLSRGTSLTGLCGIPYKRDFYIRPILDCTRAEIEGYIKENSLKFVTDSTNLSEDYTRNKIRRNILPLFFELNPSFDKAFSRCHASVEAARYYIDENADKLFHQSKLSDGFDCSVFKNQPEAVRSQAVKMILNDFNAKNISCEHIKAVENIIENGGSADISGKITLTAERDFLFLGRAEKTDYFEERLTADKTEITLPSGKYKIYIFDKKDLQNLNKQVLDNLIDCDKISSNPVLRGRREGDSFKIRGRGVTKTLKKLFNEAKIPVSKRSKTALLSDDNGVLWVEGFGAGEICAPSDKTEKYMYIERAGI